MSDTVIADDASIGRGRILWARDSMPVLNRVASELKEHNELDGVRVLVSLVLEPKTANLAYALRDAGAEVSLYCSARSTDMQTAHALRADGFDVFADRSASDEEDLNLARRALEQRPDVLIDDGAGVTRLLHREFPELLETMMGATEETTSGVRPLEMMHRDGALKIPVIAVNDAQTKYLFDNIYGTGQSCVMAHLDITNLQVAGRVVVVVGYGWVGEGVALHAAGLGARVVVSEIDPIKALKAHHDGYEVTSLTNAASRAEVVFPSTGIAGVVTPEHIENLPEGTVLATAGGGSFELPMEYLNELGTAREVRAQVMEYTTRTGRRIYVLSGGDCVNCSGAEGNPIEVMDLSLSLQAVAVKQLVDNHADLNPGLYPVSAEAEAEVAVRRLEHEGATLEEITDELAAAMRSW